MGMAASSLRFAQLTARKNQVEFEGQQINQQRLTLSQKSSAIYNDMLTRQVPTAPDPSAFTKIVYKFNNGYGTSSILNLAKKASGAYNYNVTYKRPKTTRTLSRSSFANVGFARTIGVTQISPDQKNNAVYYARTANINGVARNLSLVGGSSAAGKLAAYRSKLETYKNMKTIEEQISSLSSKKATDTVSTSTQQNIKSALGLDLTTVGGQEPARTAIEKALFGDNTLQTPTQGLTTKIPNQMALNESYTEGGSRCVKTAYNMAVALGATKPDKMELDETLNHNEDLNQWVFTDISNAMSEHLRTVLTGSKTGKDLKEEFKFQGKYNDQQSQDKIASKYDNLLNDLEKVELINLLVQYANTGKPLTNTSLEAQYKVTDENYEKYENYGQAANSLYNIASGNQADETITNEQMINMLKELLKETSEADGKAAYNSSGEYKKGEVDPAFTQYQASVATPGIQNISEGQMLYTYQDDNGETCYMYVSIDNILDDGSSTYADSVSIYENVLNYLDGEYETEQQDANVIMSEDGQVAKITFADGTVVTPEIVTEMDNDAYDQAMVEYEYKKEVYDKEMNDANAKVKIIQAQDQKLEVRLKQLDTEQKALQTEIDAVKSIRDKSIESSFKTFS